MSDRAGSKRSGTSWRRTQLIARRELRERITQRAYRIALVVGAVLAAAAVAVPTLLDGGGDSPTIVRVPVAFDGATASDARSRASALSAAIREQGDTSTRVRLESAAEARRLVRDGGKDTAVLVTGSASAPRVTILAREGGGDATAIVDGLQRLAMRARLDAIAPDRTAAVLAPIDVRGERIDGGGPTGAATAVVSVFGLVVYITGILLMTSFATGVVSDRAGRVTERLLTAARPEEHLAGKLLGVGAAGLLQVGVWLLGGIAAAALLAGSVSDTFGGVSIGLIAFFPIAIVMTYVSYAALSIVLVLPVRKTEDVGSALAPATLIQVVTFILASGQVRPGAVVPPVIEALSFVPFLSPLLMLIRIAGGGVAWWEVAVAIGLTGLAAALLIRVAAPAYARYAIEAPGGKGLGAALAALRR